jgi:glucose/arabinose dehydrogenase
MDMRISTIALSLSAAAIASCGSAQSGDSAAQASGQTTGWHATELPAGAPFKAEALGSFDNGWALRMEPGTGRIFVTEKPGTMKVVDPRTGRIAAVTGVPQVAYGGQGGLADFTFAPDYKTSHAVYLSWAEAGENGDKGGAIGRGTLDCAGQADCKIENLKVIWRQQPKFSGQLQYALRLTFSPDGKYLFVSSGDRVDIDLVQKFDNDLGKILRLMPDGTAAKGNPFADKGHPADEIWTIGHRNPLGLKFDLDGQLWDLEHGPAGGDEINKLVPGDNYGWPLVSNGDNYNGTPIPRHSTRLDFHAPAISWNPVIAPGDMIFYSGRMWPEWKGQALIAGMKTQAIIRVSLSDDHGTELARYDMGHRIRDLIEAPDGSLYVLEDGKDGRLLHLTPQG